MGRYNGSIPLQPLSANPILTQMNSHLNENTKKINAKTVIQNLVADLIFCKIIACETVKEVFEKKKRF